MHLIPKEKFFTHILVKHPIQCTQKLFCTLIHSVEKRNALAIMINTLHETYRM